MTTRTMHLEARQGIAVPGARRRRAPTAIMVVLCWLVAAYALVLLMAARFRPPLMQARFDEYALATSVHLALGMLVIELAPLQLSRRMRGRHPMIHGWTGRVYAVAALGAGSPASCSRACRSGAQARTSDSQFSRWRGWRPRSWASPAFGAVTSRATGAG